jgi:hypothetical protein
MTETTVKLEARTYCGEKSPSAARSAGRVDARRADGWGFAVEKSLMTSRNCSPMASLARTPLWRHPTRGFAPPSPPSAAEGEVTHQTRHLLYADSERSRLSLVEGHPDPSIGPSQPHRRQGWRVQLSIACSLQFEKLCITAGLGQQFLMSAGRLNLAVCEDKNTISHAHA